MVKVEQIIEPHLDDYSKNDDSGGFTAPNGKTYLVPDDKDGFYITAPNGKAYCVPKAYIVPDDKESGDKIKA